ncbi:MAG: hypothetical protein GXP02_10065 [Alphaproteobacteria bacterium]|nr:hypothetical protein [Alphaproteobacteria bacterium]
MTRQLNPLVPTAFSYKRVRHAFPWSKIILSFLMTSSFLIFATTGASGAETIASWSGHVGDIIVGTALFSLASVLLVWARRLLPKNI